MAGSAGELLFESVRREVLALLGDARQALEDAGRLDGLGPAGPAWAQTALAEHLLAPIEDLEVPQPGFSAVLHKLAALGPADTSAGPWQGGLHGWDPGRGGRRGMALAVLVSGATGAAPLAAALVVIAGEGGPLVSLVASGVGAIPAGSPVAIALGGDAQVQASGAVAGLLSIEVAGDGPPTVSAATAGDHVEMTITGRVGDLLIAGTRLRVGSASLNVGASVNAAGTPSLTISLALPEAAFQVESGPLSVLLGDMLELPAALEIASRPGQGITLNGSTALRVPLPTPGALGPLDVRRLDATLAAGTGDGLTLRLGVDADLRVAVGLPALQITLEGLGTSMPLAFGPDVAGPQPSGAGIVLPTGVAVALDADVLFGGGELSGGDRAYAGGLALTLPPMSVAAFGSFVLPGLGHPELSLLIVLGVRFPLPGIEIGFGFAVSGVGGIVGLNRRVDRDALTAAVLDGRAVQLLFPANPAAALPTVAAVLPAIFPTASGRFVVGPILELSWGGRLVHMVVAVVVELPDPVRFTVLGKLTVTVPDEVAPLILIHATILAEIDTTTPSVTVLASLAGSNLVGMPLTGDLFLLTRGGSEPEFVISAGGFHPAFRAPAGVPALRRLSMRMRTAIVELRCDAYLAVTSGSLQFGARVQLSAKLADCGVSGFFAFDALFVWSPVFHFSVGLAAGLAVEVFGATLLGIAIEMTIEGPSPWHFVGSGHIETLVFDVPISIDETWGGAPPTVEQGDAATPLLAALAAPEAWRASADPAALAGVALTDDGAHRVAAGTALHPLGSLQVRERILPLAIQIDRFAGARLPPQTWTIIEARLRAGRNSVRTTALQDWFALGQFVDLAAEAQLSGSGYHQFQSGVTLIGGGLDVADQRPAEIDWDTTLIGDGVAELDHQPAPWSGMDDVQSLPLDRPFAVADWASAPDGRIEVLPEQPATVALTSAVAASGLRELAAPNAPVANAAIARDWAARSAPAGLTASVVETWELSA